jgi:hypothetical protein
LRIEYGRTVVGPVVQTNPISGRVRYPMVPLCYHSTIPVRCRWCETNPIRPGLGRARYPGGRKMQNEPNLGRGGGVGGTECTKRTQFGPTREDRRGRPHRMGGLHCAKQTQFGPAGLHQGRSVRNEPNSRRGRVGRGLGDAGRGGLSRQTKPIPGEPGFIGPCLAGGTPHSCETNPIRPAPRTTGGPNGKNVRNEPNLARAGLHWGRNV